MADDNKVLDCISEAADMGRDSLHQVIGITEDDRFRQVLKNPADRI